MARTFSTSAGEAESKPLERPLLVVPPGGGRGGLKPAKPLNTANMRFSFDHLSGISGRAAALRSGNASEGADRDYLHRHLRADPWSAQLWKPGHRIGARIATTLSSSHPPADHFVNGDYRLQQTDGRYAPGWEDRTDCLYRAQTGNGPGKFFGYPAHPSACCRFSCSISNRPDLSEGRGTFLPAARLVCASYCSTCREFGVGSLSLALGPLRGAIFSSRPIASRTFTTVKRFGNCFPAKER